jgi:hypothetical protein
MATPEAVALLRAGLPRASGGAFAPLARRLGHWPLLLGIVNRQIRERAGKSRPALDRALQEVGRALEVVGLGARFDPRDPQARRAAVWRAVSIALRSLPSQDRDRLIDLAVFPSEEEIPLAVVRRLWGLGPTEARHLGKRLRDLALVSFEPWTGTLRLHTLVYGFLLRRHRSKMAVLHSRLLDVCCPASGRWEDLPPTETYLRRRLADHLLAAGRREDQRDALDTARRWRETAG